MKKTTFFVTLILHPFFFYAQTYNPQAAIEYADYWWDGRNTKNWIKDSISYNTDWGFPFNNYNHWGGDCTNFVSQCLIAGGLDLRDGADGHGKGVDNRGCIKAVDSLRAHLQYKKYSFTDTYYSIEIVSDQLYHTLGDILFIRKPDNSMRHSLFCSQIKDKTSYYNTHSADYYRVKRKGFISMSYSRYFNLTTPAHCFNCKLDEGEDDIDCGGECPPCEHAPDRVIINTPTSNLPSEVRATEEISAGNAEVKVLSGQNVDFITAGTIELLPGFEVEAGGNFNTQMKGNSFEVTTKCSLYCETEYYPNDLIRYQDYFPALTDYIAHIKTYPCLNNVGNKYSVRFYVRDSKKSSNEESEETENYAPSLTPNIENTIPQNENPSPYFSIIPNPNPGTFRFDTNFPITNIGSIKVINMQGSTVYETQQVTSNALQLPTATSGQFFVVMILKDGSVLTQKMVVQ